MPGVYHISYLASHEIEKEKWDRCISSASNGLIYSYSFYLDHMATEWDALVLNDYEAVMPLPWRKKLNVYYLYQPFLTAQLGVTGGNIDATIMEIFLNAVPKKFRLWEFSFNQGNVFTIPGFRLYERKNFILPLNDPYADIAARYSQNISRNIRKSKQFGCIPNNKVSVHHVIEMAGGNEKSGSMREFENFEKLYTRLNETGQAKIYGINSDKGELLSCCVFLFSHRRAFYILVGNHPNSRTLGASHALIDSFIQDYAGQNLLLDFEGSDIPGLAFFYSSFGASEEKYAAIRKNDLPWYVRLFK